ncbi:MAG: MarR family transcriptional regulator [Eubacterium sp.]|nr:MarR family transcriptional regulator [Eubacterium sp.]
MSCEKNMKADEIVRLFNELTYRRYLVNKDQFQQILKGIRLQEYIALYHISQQASANGVCDGKMYLEDLSRLMSMPMSNTSKMIRKLQEGGFVYWTHDGDGSNGTYAVIAKGGWELMKQQAEKAKTYYGAVLDKFGKDNMVELIGLMKKLDEVLDDAQENM